MSESTTKSTASTVKKPKAKKQGFFFSKLNKTIYAENLEKANIEANKLET